MLFGKYKDGHESICYFCVLYAVFPQKLFICIETSPSGREESITINPSVHSSYNLRYDRWYKKLNLLVCSNL